MSSEGGAGETVRRRLLKDCDVHTLLRLPTGVFYARGVKANVLFFDRRPAGDLPWTEKLWIYDLRTNRHFTPKTNPLKYEDLQDFVKATIRRIGANRPRRSASVPSAMMSWSRWTKPAWTSSGSRTRAWRIQTTWPRHW